MIAIECHRLIVGVKRRWLKSLTHTLFKAIKDGGASVGLSSEMPSWSSAFDDDEIHGLVAYIRSFCKKK
jgi:mono/diheme cytochrome c family protein